MWVGEPTKKIQAMVENLRGAGRGRTIYQRYSSGCKVKSGQGWPGPKGTYYLRAWPTMESAI